METKLKSEEIVQLLNNLPGMLYRCRYDKNWTMEFLSDGCESLTGYKKDELLYNKKVTYASLIHIEDNDWIYETVTNALDQHKFFSYEYRIIDKSGNLKWVWEQGIGIYDEDDNIIHIEGFITDITSQKELSDKLKKELYQKDKELLINLSLLNEYKKAVDESAIVTKTDPQGIITYANNEFTKISGYKREEVLGRPHNLVRHPQNPKALFETLWSTIQNKRIWKGVLKNKDKYGKSYYVKTTIVPILDFEGNIKEFMAIRHDVTDLILQEKKIKFQITDHLTQLPNRQKLLEDLEGDYEYKLAIINIERFKEVNEYYGFAVGDKLLIELAGLLLKLTKDTDIRLYKLSGDEYALLSNELIDKDSFKNFILNIIKKIKRSSFILGEYKLNIDVIAGASMQKNYYINAEMATNYAKEVKKEFIFFDDYTEIKEQLINNVNWTQKLKKSIENDHVQVFAQPIICNKENCIAKYECLVRIVEDTGDIISPVHFLNIAKKSKLYPNLTRIVIDKAIEHFKNDDSHFSINLSLEDILDNETLEFLENKLKLYNGVADRLVLEIVEDEGIENYNEVSSFIEKMKHLGCKIAIDDFGTGYSNFDYLMKLNVDYVKIDGSIIKNIHHDKNAQIVTELIVDFAQRLNIETIAEFVHNEEVQKTVSQMGVDYSQGFHLGKPEQI